EKERASALRRQGLEALKAGAFADAIDLLDRALAREPGDAATQLDLGIALQGAGRHTEALEHFAAAQKSMPEDARPFLHAAVSLLTLGEAQAAAGAADDACQRAPLSAHAHYVHGQAWLALNGNVKAERASAEALRLAPRMADAWINYGLARY